VNIILKSFENIHAFLMKEKEKKQMNAVFQLSSLTLCLALLFQCWLKRCACVFSASINILSEMVYWQHTVCTHSS